MSPFENYISSEYLKGAARELNGIKQLSFSMLNLQDAMRVLDLGCGAGKDLAQIAARMPKGGRVTGLDRSSELLREAADLIIEQDIDERAELVCASAMEIPFPGEYFDAVRADRLFQVMDPDLYNPEELMHEILRVLRPGGRLVISDTDWASASVNFPDVELERRLLNFFSSSCCPNGYAGRMIKSLMAEWDMRDVEYHVLAQSVGHVDECSLGGWLADEALRQKVITEAEARHWMSTLTAMSANGSLYACVNMVVAAGVKP